MKGFPPEPDSRVTLANWQDPPFNRWSFSHLRELVPTHPVGNGDTSYTHAVAIDEGLDSLLVPRVDRDPTSLETFLDDSYTDAVVVIHDGAIKYERYFGETRQNTPHLLMSVTKSFVGCVAGVLLDRGTMAADDLVTQYVPELMESGYRDATIRNLLDMRSGVKFSEEYTDPDAEVRIMEEAFGWRPQTDRDVPRSIYEFLTTLTKDKEHGGIFDYRSCETLTLGWVCERAAQRRMADLISEIIWTPMGARHWAEMTCDGVGTAIHDGGMCATARDLARFGSLLLAKGHLDGVDVLPSKWLRTSWRVDADIRDAFSRSKSGPYLPGGWYRNQFWFLPRRHGDVLLCLGIYGQMVYVNPGTKTVAAKLSTWPDAQSPTLLSETISAFDNIGARLAGLTVEGEANHEGPAGVASGKGP